MSAVCSVLWGCSADRERPSRAADGGSELGDGPAAESYASVNAILNRSCSYPRCHAGSIIGGALPLGMDVDTASALVGVPSCEYPPLSRVEPGHPERSWLYLKLTAEVRTREDPYADYVLFEPEPDWDVDDRPCRDRTKDGTPLFGQRMPLTAPNMLPPDELEVIRAWIAQGAPH